MMKANYLKPEIDLIEVMQNDMICTRSGIDPDGIGHDFNWGNEAGITPGGSGGDFIWGN